jgi:hypothetical protein
MNELIKAMSLDMKIIPYEGEPYDSFVYRVIFSALGRWCLESSRTDGGISKHGQSILLNDLTEKYIALFPEIKNMLVQEDQTQISVFIRQLYEETGFLITDSANHNHLANYRRGLEIGSKKLLYGLSSQSSTEGLGSFSEDVRYNISWREALLRDYLTCEEYVSSAFDVTLFSQRDISGGSLQYFDPKRNTAPSSSWINTMTTDKTVARNISNGTYYRVMRYNDEMLYYEDAPNSGTEELTDFDYRRLYYALKKYYGYPLIAQIQSLDNQYAKISLGGHLPNREYFLMLLCSWPCRMYCNKREFITKKENLCFINEVLENLGIETIGG